MKRSKYYIRVMRPTFHRAILTVEASSDKAAVLSALEAAGRLTESDWTRFEAERGPPVVEIALSEEDTEGGHRGGRSRIPERCPACLCLVASGSGGGEGYFIAPTWLQRLPELAIADITTDWTEALSGISEEGIEAFYAWLAEQRHPTNVVDFFAERDKRRGKPRDDPDADG